ncbi:MAG: cellulase family glycosylhydrolase [Proteobacteria bacterium]|nr:cellulase family glycosylhydrolase [Pseudomonadota bacterium]
MRFRGMRCWVYLGAVLFAACNPSAAGFRIEGTQLLDANGNPFVMRGVNYPHVWYRGETAAALPAIAATGANAVRVVLSTGHKWPRSSGDDVTDVIRRCRDNRLVCVLEVHDSTGYPGNDAEHISNATNYWLSEDVRQALEGQQAYVIVNIANEPFGNGVPASTYVDDHIAAIQTLRANGVRHTLMVDAANWGQDWEGIMRDNAQTIFDADPQANTIFSVHMYQVYDSADAVQGYLQAFQDLGLALVVGEFAADHYGDEVAEAAILEYAEAFDVGYLGWSWSGNSSDLESLDIVVDFDPGRLSPWGETLINGPNGIAQTSVLATVYGDAPPPPSPATCTWTDGTVWPLCEVDVGGWGWENEQSCISESICPTPAP